MKKSKVAKQFLEELTKVPIVQVACEKTGVSRTSIYRWRKKDTQFSKAMDDALAQGVAFVNDMSESQLLTMIKEKNWSAISFWLRHRNDNYKAKVHIDTSVKTIHELSPNQEKTIREALRLAGLIQDGYEDTQQRTD